MDKKSEPEYLVLGNEKIDPDSARAVWIYFVDFLMPFAAIVGCTIWIWNRPAWSLDAKVAATLIQPLAVLAYWALRWKVF